MRGSRLAKGHGGASNLRAHSWTLQELRTRRDYVRKKIQMALMKKEDRDGPMAALEFSQSQVKKWESQLSELDKKIEKLVSKN